MEEMLALMMASMGSNFISNFMESRFNRSDYRFTHNMTNYPAQVKEMREAGLNPALAYGQLSAPQGQSLGNYQSDISGSLKNLSEVPFVKQQIATSKAQEEAFRKQASYYDKLAFKTGEEGLMTNFSRLHQEEAFKIDMEHKGLVNLKLDNENTLVRLKVTEQEIQNEISRIDLKYHDQQSYWNVRKTVAETGLQIALSRTEDTLRNARLQEIRHNIRLMMAQYGYFSSLTTLTNNQSVKAKYDALMSKTQQLYLDWLTDDNSSFRKMNRREAWKVYGSSISQGIGAAVGTGTAVFLNKGKGINSQTPNWSSYGPGRDNLGH